MSTLHHLAAWSAIKALWIVISATFQETASFATPQTIGTQLQVVWDHYKTHIWLQTHYVLLFRFLHFCFF